MCYEENKIYTVQEAGEILNLSEQTIQRMCERGKFPGAKQTSSGHWLIPKKLFKVTLEEARKIRDDLKDIREKSLEAGEEDEFDLVD